MFAGGLGAQELLIIFLIILLLFGARKIPEVGRSLGKGIREFKRATKEISSEVNLDEDEEPSRRAPSSDRSTGAGPGPEKPAG